MAKLLVAKLLTSTCLVASVGALLLAGGCAGPEIRVRTFGEPSPHAVPPKTIPWHAVGESPTNSYTPIGTLFVVKNRGTIFADTSPAAMAAYFVGPAIEMGAELDE